MTTDMKEHIPVKGEVVSLTSLVAQALGENLVPPWAEGVVIRDVCDDSRQVTPGALFVAVTGTRADGATFMGDAATRGAAAIVVGGARIGDCAGAPAGGVPGGPVVITVPDARHALARLASVYFGLVQIQADGQLNVTGVTGTNGKTTVAYMLRSILRAADRRAAMLGTIEYDLAGRRMLAALTTPGPVALTRHLVEAHAAGARYVVMEVSSHSLDQRRTDGIRFSTAIFTNLTQDHLDYHKTTEDYLRAKRRLFDSLSSDAVAVVNADEPVSERLVENCRARVITYGMDTNMSQHSCGTGVSPRPPDCGTGVSPVSSPPRRRCHKRRRHKSSVIRAKRTDVRGDIVETTGSGSRFVLTYQSEHAEIHTPLVGEHNVANALAAGAAGLALGLDLSTIQRGLAALAYVPGRLQRVDTGSLGFDVFVDYAHTDDALRHVLRAVRPLTRGRLWCVFGCGGDRDSTKRPLMARAVADGADAFIITGDNPRTEDPMAIIADIERGLSAEDRQRAMTVPDRAEAIARGVDQLARGDVLVIAGKGHEDYQILGTEKVHFDDVEVARDAIESRRKPKAES